MRKTYSVLASAIALGVVIQAAAIAFGFGGMMHYVVEGGVVDKAMVESQEASFTGVPGFVVHGIVGGMVIPLLAFALLGVSFAANLPRGRRLAGLVLALVVVQTMAGYSIEGLPYLGVLHGANALAILVAALAAARLARQPQSSASEGVAPGVVRTPG